MTINEIDQTLKTAGKKFSRVHLHRLFLRLNIRPAGVRQRPQQYPDSAAVDILAALGLGRTAPSASSSPAAPSPAPVPAGRLMRFSEIKNHNRKAAGLV